MANKRKRVSEVASQREETSETASTDMDTNNGVIPVADKVFDIQVYKDSKSTPKKPRSKNSSDMLEEKAWRPNDKPILYRITPGPRWERMKKYKNFVVSTKTFGTGDYVYIYHGNEAQGANLDPAKVGDCWVAKVLEIRAEDSSHVFLRVLWLYWPEELPKTGRLPCHASSELIASNYMEVMDAMTVTDKAEVAYVAEEYHEPPAEGLFWRQTFDFLTGKLSELRPDCICEGPNNPDRKLIYCQGCGKWLHEGCLLNDALNRFSSRKQKKGEEEKAAEGPGQEQEEIKDDGGSDTIMVNEKPEAEESPEKEKESAPAKQKLAPKSRRKARKSSLSSAKATEIKPAWEGTLEARLEMKTDEQGEETDDATGNVIITDLDGNGDGEHETFKEELRCLCCEASLADQPDQAGQAEQPE